MAPFIHTGNSIGKNRKAIAIVGIVLIALFLLSNSGIPLLSGTTATSGLSQASPISGATITGIQNVGVVSNYANLTGSLFLTSFTITGAGQALNGTQSQIASGINSSYSTKTNNPVSIKFALQNEGVNYNYQNSGIGLYYWSLVPIGINYMNASCQTGFLGLSQCTQSDSNTGANYTIVASALTGSSPTQMVLTALNGFNAVCTKQNAVMVTVGPAQSISGTSSVGIQVSCVRPQQNLIGGVWNSVSKNYILNASVTITNGTTTGTIQLSGTKPTGYYRNVAYAQIYGYTQTNYQLNDQQTPTLFIFNNGTTRLVNPFSTATGLANGQGTAGLPQSWLQPVLVQGFAVPGLYSVSSLKTQVNQSNAQVNNYLYSPQLASPFSSMKVAAHAGLGSTNVGTIDLTSTPSFYPQVQMLVGVSTLSLYIPVAQPQITSVAPKPTVFTSGATAPVTFTVYNNASVTASAYISGSIGNQTFGPSVSFSVPAKGSIPITINVASPYNPVKGKTESYTCAATVYSTSYGLSQNTVNWPCSVMPTPSGAGAVYTNSTTGNVIAPTLKNSTFNQTGAGTTGTATGCRAGYILNGNTCQLQGCGAGYYINTTTSTPSQTVCSPFPSNGSGSLGTYGLAVFIVIIAAILVWAKFIRKAKGRGRRR